MNNSKIQIQNLLKSSGFKEIYENLMLFKKEGIFLDLIPEEVKVLEYRISDSKFVLFRKIYNRLKLITLIVVLSISSEI